jgi:hypothetical protein
MTLMPLKLGWIHLVGILAGGFAYYALGALTSGCAPGCVFRWMACTR